MKRKPVTVEDWYRIGKELSRIQDDLCHVETKFYSLWPLRISEKRVQRLRKIGDKLRHFRWELEGEMYLELPNADYRLFGRHWKEPMIEGSNQDET